MNEKWPKTLIKIVRTVLAQNNAQWEFHLSQELYDTNFQTKQKIFSPMVINAQWISLTHEQLHFLIDLCEESFMISSTF